MRLLLILILSQISFTASAEPEKSQRASPTHMKMLPKLCQLRFEYGYSSNEFKTWRARLGKDALHVHHYCDGLVFMFRSVKRTKHRNHLLGSARSNFNYTLRALQNPNYILLPDIYYRLSVVENELGNKGEAMMYANKSIQAKKSYLKPYILLAEMYTNAGNKKAAKETLLEAQKYHPNSKTLKKRLKKL